MSSSPPRETPQPVSRPARHAAGHHHPLLSARHQLHRIAHLTHLHLPAGLLRRVDRSGPLESPWVAAGLGGLLAKSVLLTVRRRRRAGRAGLVAWLSGLTALTGLAGLNVYVGYVPTLPALLGDLPSPGRDGGSQVAKLMTGAPGLNIPPSPAYVYLPPGYDDAGNAARRYPVVYLLHGYPGGPSDWFRGAQVQQVMDAMLRDRLVQPMIVVAPDASGGCLHDSEMLNQVGGPQVATYLTVVGAVDGRYRTVPDRAGRAIGGMSSGGYGALNLGLRHQDRYSVILSEMPTATPGRSPGACWVAAKPCGWPTRPPVHPDHGLPPRDGRRPARRLPRPDPCRGRPAGQDARRPRPGGRRHGDAGRQPHLAGGAASSRTRSPSPAGT